METYSRAAENQKFDVRVRIEAPHAPLKSIERKVIDRVTRSNLGYVIVNTLNESKPTWTWIAGYSVICTAVNIIAGNTVLGSLILGLEIASVSSTGILLLQNNRYGRLNSTMSFIPESGTTRKIAIFTPEVLIRSKKAVKDEAYYEILADGVSKAVTEARRLDICPPIDNLKINTRRNMLTIAGKTNGNTLDISYNDWKMEYNVATYVDNVLQPYEKISTLEKSLFMPGREEYMIPDQDRQQIKSLIPVMKYGTVIHEFGHFVQNAKMKHSSYFDLKNMPYREGGAELFAAASLVNPEFEGSKKINELISILRTDQNIPQGEIDKKYEFITKGNPDSREAGRRLNSLLTLSRRHKAGAVFAAVSLMISGDPDKVTKGMLTEKRKVFVNEIAELVAEKRK
jgi:hypothetical protein